MSAANERLIVALDVPRARDALALVDALGNAVSFYKVGLELFAAGEARPLLAELKRRDLRVFADMKLFDVPETVARAAAQIAESGADFLTVHGDAAIMRAAVKAAEGAPLKILAVTALTSLDENDLREAGFSGGINELVLSRARRARECGCGGVVASGREVKSLRAEVKDCILVVPGVRPASYQTADDQKRTATPAQIVRDGGDYLVAGRPIRSAEDPRRAAQNIVREIAAAAE